MAAFIAGIGALVAGVGFFKGSSKVGNAAESVADHTGRAVESITKDIKEIKTYLIQEIGPNVNVTLQGFQEVLGRAEEFIITGTFATKALAFLIFLLAALVCEYITSAINGKANTHRPGKRIPYTRSLKTILVQLVQWICMLMVVLLAVHLVMEIGKITWPTQMPYQIFIIPSITTLAMCLQYLVAFLKWIWKIIKSIPQWIIGYPVGMFCKPISSGYQYYQNSSTVLSFIIISIIAPMYSFAVPFFMLCIEAFQHSKITPFQVFLSCYVIFVATALVFYIIWMFLLRPCIRPIWAYSAKRNYRY